MSTHNALSPWIESLILNYGSQEGSRSRVGLRAQVVDVGPMSLSQVRASDRPRGLLFLSDGVLRIPALVTPSAWDHFQDLEDRDSFGSLLNTIVCIQHYRLHFLMAPDDAECKFFLTVGQLGMAAASPVEDNTPSYTTLASVKQKICQTWRSLQDQDQEVMDAEESQYGIDLTELLEEWHRDYMQCVQEDAEERLTKTCSSDESSQPCASNWRSHTSTTTRWDIDRVRYKGEKSFTVPLKYLLIPEDVMQGKTVPVLNNILPNEVSSPPKATSKESVDDRILQDDMIVELTDSGTRPLSNPWDIFPPPSVTSSCSEASLDLTPTQIWHCLTESNPVKTSMQLPAQSSTQAEQASEHSKDESSLLPPYQNAPSSSGPLISVGSSATDSVSELCTDVAPKSPPLDHVSQSLETEERKCGKAKRKRSGPPPEHRGKDVQVSRSPPSWLFDTQAGSRAQEKSLHQQAPAVGSVSRRAPSIHSDGTPFSYSYKVSGQNLQDLSQFKVANSMVQWAVRYLLAPKQNDDPDSTAVTLQSKKI